MDVAREIIEFRQRSSWIRKMFETGARLKHEHGPDKVFDFSLGNPDLPPPARFKEVCTTLLQDETRGIHGYMPNAGYRWVRDKIAAQVSRNQGIEIPAGSIILSCGAGGALNVLLKSILNPGEKVLASLPCFMEYAFYTANHGGEFATVPCTADFDLDIDAFARAIDDRTKAVIINSPNNPSGKIYSAAKVDELAALLTRYRNRTGRTIYLISDEPYREIVYGTQAPPAILPRYPHTIMVYSYSKSLSLAGERIGWLAVNPQAAEYEALVDNSIFCTRVLGFVNAPASMQRVIAELSDARVDVAEYRKRRDILCNGLCKIGYDLHVPEGSFYLFPRAPGGDDLAFIDCLQSELILAVPGRGFGLPGYFRLAYCMETDHIAQSLGGFARAFAAAGGATSPEEGAQS